MTEELATHKDVEVLENSLSRLFDGLNTEARFGAPASSTETLQYNLRYYLVSNNRSLLSQLYVEHGIVQTLVDQPVDDGFRAGFEIKSGQLEGNDIELIQNYLERNGVIEAVKQGLKWARLFGGGGVLLITPQNPATPFTVESLRSKTEIEFHAIDMWELYQDRINFIGDLHPKDGQEDFYNYYGNRVHDSRVYTFRGKEPPSFIRPRLRGWGMSEIERLIRSINQYLKNQDVVFELLDEAKVDIFKIEGFNTSLLNIAGTNKIQSRIQLANLLKDYNNALVMDTKDEYAQKQMSFAGLNDIIEQIRIGVAADLKMPMSKLFGVSNNGLGSGEDEIENYNSMIEGEVRTKAKPIVLDFVGIACQQLFGFCPDDLQIIWNPLRILNAEEEEKVKDSQFNRLTTAYTAGAISTLDYKRGLNKDSLLPVEIDETDETYTPPALGQDLKVDNASKNEKET